MKALRQLAWTFVLSPLFAAAQVAPNPSSKTEGEAIVLSPFVVNTEGESGYQASSTLAGSRIKTDLKGIAASVTVLTTEFLGGLGAKDVASAMALVAGTETDAKYEAKPGDALGGPGPQPSRSDELINSFDF